MKLQMAMINLDVFHHFVIQKNKSLVVNITNETASFVLPVVENCLHAGSVMTKLATILWIGNFSGSNEVSKYPIKISSKYNLSILLQEGNQ